MASAVLSSLSLSPELLAIIDEKIASGRYGSVEEVIAAGLRCLDPNLADREANEAHLAATLHEAEERLRVLSDHLPGGMIYQVVVDKQGNRRFQYVSAGVENLFGVSPVTAIQDPEVLYGAILEDDRPRIVEAEAEVLRSHAAFNVEVRVRHTRGDIRWVRLASAPRVVHDGATIWDGFAIDITGRRRSEMAFRESEARFRHMADSAPALIWMTDAEGQVIFANMHYDYVFGRPAADMLGDGWREIILSEDLEEYEAAFREAFEARRPFKREVRVVDKDGQVRWLRCDGVARLDDGGSFLGYTGCNMDITDVRLAQERQTLLINELNHRVKNTLATVQSVAMQTLRNAVTTEQARDDFETRLIALSRAHDVLTRENWHGANLQEIVDQAIEPYRAEEGRFRIKGPAVRLPPRMALALAMALQELATNAVKYGALSNATGRVEIAWKVERGGEEPRLRLRWSESGGPPVEAPRRRGFGSRLIERSLSRDLNGEASLAFEPAGLVCTVDAPIQTS